MSIIESEEGKTFQKLLLMGIAIALLAIITGAGGEFSAVVQGQEIELEYAENFEMEIVEENIIWVEDGYGQEFILAGEGEDIPAEYDETPVIRTPVDNAMFTTSVHAALLRPLDVYDNIGAVTRDADGWHIDEMAEKIENEEITYVGDADSPDYELIEKVNPEVVLLTTPRYIDTMDKLNELGFETFVVNAGYEHHPLARLESIKILGALFDKLEEAENYFDSSLAELDDVIDRIPEDEERKVAIGRDFSGGPMIPEGGNYGAAKVELAGGDYAFSHIGEDSTGFVDIDMEEFYREAVDADLFIYNFTFIWEDSLEGLLETAPVLEDVKAIQEENIWTYQDWFFQSADLTHEIIEDLAILLYPEVFEDREVRHYKPLR